MGWNDGIKNPRKCVICGKVFIPKVKTQVTCSRECGVIHNRQQQRMRDEEYKAIKVKGVHKSTMDEIRAIARKGIHYGQLVVEMERENGV